MNVKQLRAAAKEAGVDDAKIEEARDGDDPKADLIKLIKEQEAAKSKAEEAVPPTDVVLATEAETTAKVREQEEHLAEISAHATEVEEKTAMLIGQAKEEQQKAATQMAELEKLRAGARRATLELERAKTDHENGRQSMGQQRGAGWVGLAILLLGSIVALVIFVADLGDASSVDSDAVNRRFDHLPCDHPENEDCHVLDALPNCDEYAYVVADGAVQAASASCAVEFAPGGELSGMCDKHCGICQNMLDELQNTLDEMQRNGHLSSTERSRMLAFSGGCDELIARGTMSCATNFTRGGNYEGLCNVACGLCEEGQHWECKKDLDCGVGRQCNVDWFDENDCECADEAHDEYPDATFFTGAEYDGCDEGFECQVNTYSNNECVRDGTAQGTPWYAYALYSLPGVACCGCFLLSPVGQEVLACVDD
eukprot:COSAG02_NODE_916_length_15971_cov_12.781061_12_plen_425_part_00